MKIEIDLPTTEIYSIIKQQILYELTIGKQYLTDKDATRLQLMIDKYVPLNDILFLKTEHLNAWPKNENLLEWNI